jgi:ABC-type siderophore export system fused ATPase/permease subunit
MSSIPAFRRQQEVYAARLNSFPLSGLSLILLHLHHVNYFGSHDHMLTLKCGRVTEHVIVFRDAAQRCVKLTQLREDQPHPTSLTF